MNGYKCFFKGKVLDVYAATPLAARDKAAAAWKVKPYAQFRIAVVLCERADGSAVVHTPSF